MATGRGAQSNPPNRFQRIQVEEDREQLDADDLVESSRRVPTEYFADSARSLLSENDSPDLPFRFSVNPYRGCAHGCSYCYARPSHEYLGLSAGLDFETKILVKQDAPRLLREHLADRAWRPEPIMFSGVTDCYQPAERTFRLTRQCLEVAWEARQPVTIITKNALITRDLDLLSPMAAARLVAVAISINSLDQALTRVLEPRTSAPVARLRAIQELATAGVPVSAMVAPVIPGLNDSEIPAVLRTAAEHGAHGARYNLLRLPSTVLPVFLEWLERHLPERRPRVEALVRSTREGRLNNSEFGTRMRGTGEFAEQLRRTFQVFAKRFGLDGPAPELDASQFRRPAAASGQQWLFEV